MSTQKYYPGHVIMQRNKTAATALVILLFMLVVNVSAQTIDSALLYKQWKASWITVPGSSASGYGVYLFRKDIDLPAIPLTCPVQVSGDNRYKLFVNEKLVSLGPARGDVLHWNYETVDLSPFLRKGHNVIAAQVWNEGELRQEANASLRTGLIIQGASAEGAVFNTDGSWKCIRDSGYSPVKITLPAYYVAGPGELADKQRSPDGWKMISYDDSAWKTAQTIGPGYPKNKVGFGGPDGWMLVPSALPQMELRQQRLAKLCRAEGIEVAGSFPATKTPVTIPANTVATLLLDQSFLTNAYPTIIFSGGSNATITLGYAEALYSKYPEKGNRNETAGKMFIGRKDSILSNGTNLQEYTTLSWRTYRYMKITLRTKDSPLTLEDVYGTFTGYPFTLQATLETENSELQQMLDIGWRTARLCAVETYMDCPYYEQLQYIGDTRIQALVSFYNSGDDRLVRNAINLIDYSRQPEGLTMSRYPTNTAQYISPFSLWYISMLHDYMMYGKDRAFVQNKLIGARQILQYFKNFQQPDGSIKNLPGWNFTDWVAVKNWTMGTRSTGENGNSSLMDLQLLWAYELAADMEQQTGSKEFSVLYKQRADQLKKTIRTKYWDAGKNLFADRPEKDLFSQHANALAILTEVVTAVEAGRLGKQLLNDSTLAPCSIYFKYYLHEALIKAGLGDGYLDWLGKWRENISMGMSTWGETSDVNTTRSDCHAWGASPNIEFFRTILGIDSDAPGFARVKIEPHPGSLKKIGGEIPHPNGKIQVSYSVSNGHMQASVQLPAGIYGRFVWKGKNYQLKAGKNNINI